MNVVSKGIVLFLSLIASGVYACELHSERLYTQMTSALNPNASDILVSPGPSDTVSEISFCPVADFLAVSSWDNQVCSRSS
jgi:hypothetical protein